MGTWITWSIYSENLSKKRTINTVLASQLGWERTLNTLLKLSNASLLKQFVSLDIDWTEPTISSSSLYVLIETNKLMRLLILLGAGGIHVSSYRYHIATILCVAMNNICHGYLVSRFPVYYVAAHRSNTMRKVWNSLLQYFFAYIVNLFAKCGT